MKNTVIRSRISVSYHMYRTSNNVMSYHLTSHIYRNRSAPPDRPTEIGGQTCVGVCVWALVVLRTATGGNGGGLLPTLSLVVAGTIGSVMPMTTRLL